MYNFFLIFHSWNRWFVLLLGLWVLITSFISWKNNRSFTRKDNLLSASFIGALHLQLLLGLVLYIFLSPMVKAAFNNIELTMKTKELRYWGIEHITGMVLGVIVAQVGRILIKKNISDIKKHKKQFFYYLTSLSIILITVIFASRPWFRF